MFQPAAINAVRGAEREVILAADFRFAQSVGGGEDGIDGDHVITVAMHQKNRRLAGGLCQMLWSYQNAGIAENRRRRCCAAKADMQGHHRALAEADQRQTVMVEAQSIKLRIEKRVERRPCSRHPAPTLGRIAHRERKPLSAHWRHAARLWRVRRYKDGIGEPVLPLLAQLNQIIAVRAIAMEKHHEVLGFAGFWF